MSFDGQLTRDLYVKVWHATDFRRLVMDGWLGSEWPFDDIHQLSSVVRSEAMASLGELVRGIMYKDLSEIPDDNFVYPGLRAGLNEELVSRIAGLCQSTIDFEINELLLGNGYSSLNVPPEASVAYIVTDLSRSVKHISFSKLGVMEYIRGNKFLVVLRRQIHPEEEECQ